MANNLHAAPALLSDDERALGVPHLLNERSGLGAKLGNRFYILIQNYSLHIISMKMSHEITYKQAHGIKPLRSNSKSLWL